MSSEHIQHSHADPKVLCSGSKLQLLPVIVADGAPSRNFDKVTVVQFEIVSLFVFLFLRKEKREWVNRMILMTLRLLN